MPETRTTGEQAVVRIQRGERLRGSGGITGQAHRPVRTGLLEGAARDDEADNVFHIPAALHELHRQPVENFRINRALALQAEVSRCAHQAGAEEHLPEMIHDHPRGERIFPRHDPLRQSESVGARAFRPGRDLRRRSRGDFFPVLVPLAAQQDMRGARLLALGEHHHLQRAGGGGELLELGLRAVESGFGFLIGRMVFEKLREEPLPQSGRDAPRIAAGKGQVFQRRARQAANGLARLVGEGDAEFADVRIPQCGAVLEFDEQFLVRLRNPRLLQGKNRRVRLRAVRALGGPAVAWIVIQGVLHIAIVFFALLVRADIGHRAAHHQLPHLRAAERENLRLHVGQDEFALLPA